MCLHSVIFKAMGKSSMERSKWLQKSTEQVLWNWFCLVGQRTSNPLLSAAVRSHLAGSGNSDAAGTSQSSFSSVIAQTSFSAFAAIVHIYFTFPQKRLNCYFIWKPIVRAPRFLQIHTHLPKMQMRSKSKQVPWMSSKSLLLSTHKFPLRICKSMQLSASLQAKYMR